MTLDEMLKSIHKNVRIGTDKGQGGFIYCGKAEKCDLVELDRYCIDKFCESVQNCKDDMKLLEDKLKDPHKAYSSYKRFASGHKTDDRKIMTYKQWYAEQVSLLNGRQKSLKKRYDKVIDYQPMRKRFVVDVYASITDPNVDIIIIDGEEVGEWWDEEEYERRYE